jgi:hypothetical protein
MKRESGGSIVSPGGPGIPPAAVLRDPSQPAQMGVGEPFVDKRVQDPAALAYANRAQGRRREQLPMYTQPVAGGPDVSIPRLDGEATEGTMAEQAARQRMPMPNVGQLVAGMAQQPALRGGGIVEGASHQQPMMAKPKLTGTPTLPGVQAGDILPEEATHDPSFQQGHGSMFAVNQPAMAAKYGVVRGKDHISPQLLAGVRTPATGSRTPLRPETVEGLQALEAARRRADQSGVDKQVQEESMRGPAGGAGQTKPAMSEDEIQKLLESLDDYDISRVKRALFKDMLNNESQREIVEARLQPLDLSSLITSGRVTQLVPIVPGQLEPEFQSYDGEEDLVIKRLVGIEARTSGANDRYILDKYQLMGLTIALRALNRQQLPDYLDAEGVFDEDLFWKKYEIVSRFNYHLLASLTVNWFWFDTRVRRLLRAEELGNG